MMNDLCDSAAVKDFRGLLLATLLVFSLATGVVGAQQAAGTTRPVAAAKASPDGLSTFGIKPSHATLAAPLDARSRFDYAATPGAVQPDYVAVSNDAYTPVQLSIYASDAFNTPTDGFDLLPATQKPTDIGSWITLKAHTLQIKARGTVVVPFAIRVPQRVTPGDHEGGIVVSLRTTQLDKKGDRVAVDHRVGVRIYLRVQGALDPRLSISNVRAVYHGSRWNPFARGHVTVTYLVHNPGNVRLGASQSVNVTGWYGGTVQSPPVLDVPELLPGNSHEERAVVNGVLPGFHETALALVVPFALPGQTDPRLPLLNATAHFWAVPWGLLLVIVLLVLGAGYLLRRWLRTRHTAPAADIVTVRKNVGAKP